MVRLPRALALLVALGIVAVLPLPMASAGPAENASAKAVRQAREAFNEAIVRKDVAAISALLAPTYHIVTGRSDQFHGGVKEAAEWARRFRADPTMSYRRATRDIIVNEPWGLAQETGDWSGAYTASGQPIVASGVYAAKWQRAENGRWRLQAEIFTTLKCEGPETGCVKPQPIRDRPGRF